MGYAHRRWDETMLHDVSSLVPRDVFMNDVDIAARPGPDADAESKRRVENLEYST